MVKQYHKPPMTGNGNHTTFKNCDLEELFIFVLPTWNWFKHLIWDTTHNGDISCDLAGGFKPILKPLRKNKFHNLFIFIAAQPSFGDARDGDLFVNQRKQSFSKPTPWAWLYCAGQQPLRGSYTGNTPSTSMVIKCVLNLLYWEPTYIYIDIHTCIHT